MWAVNLLWLSRDVHEQCLFWLCGVISFLVGYNTIQIKLRWTLFVTYTIIQSIMRSEMCSLHLTHPSGAVGSRHCGARGAVGGSVPCSRVSPQSWTLPARAGIRITSGFKSNALSIRPRLPTILQPHNHTSTQPHSSTTLWLGSWYEVLWSLIFCPGEGVSGLAHTTEGW